MTVSSPTCRPNRTSADTGDTNPPQVIGIVKRGELIELTTGIKIACTHHYSDPEVQPGELDIVLVPGPDPDTQFDPAAIEWLAAQGARKETDILSVCSGIYLCGAAGLVKGRKACGPRMLQSELKQKFEGATWVGDEYRWMQDGNFWSCGMSSSRFFLPLPARSWNLAYPTGSPSRTVLAWGDGVHPSRNCGSRYGALVGLADGDEQAALPMATTSSRHT